MRCANPQKPRSIGASLALALALAAGMFGASACGSKARTADDVAIENRAIDVRLQGAWKIGSFKPEEPLGAVLDDMLAYEQPILVVHFENGRIRADGPGVDFDRRYEVQNTKGDQFQIVAYDDTNTPQLSYCDFEPDGSVKVYMTSPWRGRGTLVRAKDQ